MNRAPFDYEFPGSKVTLREVALELFTLAVTLAVIALYASGFTLGLRLWGMS